MDKKKVESKKSVTKVTNREQHKKKTSKKKSKKNSIKKLNKKGFTLVELLAIIAILAIVSSVSIYGISSILEKTRKRTYEVTINNIETAASNYLTENSDKLLFIDNNTEEYQCIQVQNLVDMGYFDNDITNSKVSSDETVGLEDYIYIARDTTTKTVTKTIYLDESYTNYNTVCSSAVEATSDIRFTIIPSGWSKTKDITIYYVLKNALNSSNYQNNYQYKNNDNKLITSNIDVGKTTTITIKEKGTIYAQIANKETSSNLISVSQAITKIDNDGPTISENYNNNLYVSKKVTIPIIITDSESGVNGDKFNQDNVTITVGGKQVNDISITKENNTKYNLTINTTNENGEVIIKILQNTVFDNVGNGNEEVILKPNVKFDNVIPIANITTTDTLKSTTQTATLKCTDDIGVTSYYWSTNSPSNSSTYQSITSNVEFSTSKTVSTSGTYYLVCKDSAGNISTNATQVYNSYTVKNMLVTIEGTISSYTTNNYQEESSNTYIAPYGTSLKLTSIYTIPTGSNSKRFLGVSLNSPSTLSANITTDTQELNNNSTYTMWFSRNTIYFKFKPNGGTITNKTTNDDKTYTWTTDSNGYITKSINGETSSNNIASLRYSSESISLDLPNYNNSKYLEIKKTGYLATSGKEWICESGCKTSNLTFDQNSTTYQSTNEICDVSKNDCTVVLKVNWTTNTYKISYSLNNGTKGQNAPTSATYDTNVTISNPTKTVTVQGNANSTGATVGSATSKAQTFAGWTATSLDTSTAKYGTNLNSISTSWSNGTTKVTNNYFKNLTSTNNGTVTLTANWTGVALTLPTVTKTGYKCGWNTSSSGTTIKYDSGASYTPSANSATTITMYAVCVSNSKYTLISNEEITGGTKFETEYDYSGKEKTVTIPLTMQYIFQVWGAQGGPNASKNWNWRGGYGGFSTGTKTLSSNTSLYINVGGSGSYNYYYDENWLYCGYVYSSRSSDKKNCKVKSGYADAGYNGGGKAYYHYYNFYAKGAGSGSGGGATHISTRSGILSELELYTSSIIIVAGGGGGGAHTYRRDNKNGTLVYRNGGSGGGYKGNNGKYYTYCGTAGQGGTQTSGYKFGLGEQNYSNIDDFAYTGSGGGGWYGGTGGYGCDPNYKTNPQGGYPAGGGGGSGYIGGTDAANGSLTNRTDSTNYMVCYSCATYTISSSDSNYQNFKYVTKSVTNVSSTAKVDYAKENNGYARITTSNGQNGYYSNGFYYTLPSTNNTYTISASGINSTNINNYLKCDNGSTVTVTSSTSSSVTFTISGDEDDICRFYKS